MYITCTTVIHLVVAYLNPTNSPPHNWGSLNTEIRNLAKIDYIDFHLPFSWGGTIHSIQDMTIHNMGFTLRYSHNTI